MLKKGFYTALGTPLDKNGDLVEASLRKHIRQQIEAGASGLLLMGSMGKEATIKLSAYKEIVRVAADENNGTLPLFVGAMDTSIAKVMEKIDTMLGLKIDGVVLTTPFYGAPTDAAAINFFTTIADKSPLPIYLYDLAGVVKYKVTMPVMDVIIKHPNIKGIKTADWELIQKINRKYPEKNFECLYSGLDSFDYANMMGIDKNLDGMFSCTPKNGRKMYDCINAGDFEGARKYLDNILLLRDTMAKSTVLLACFTHCMNLLGCEGSFHQDYMPAPTEEDIKLTEKVLREIGEI